MTDEKALEAIRTAFNMFNLGKQGEREAIAVYIEKFGEVGLADSIRRGDHHQGADR